MRSKLTLNISTFLLLLTILFSFSACNSVPITSDTKMVFSFNTSLPADSYDEKVIYINNDMDKLILNAKLEIDSGVVSIQVVSANNQEIVWNENFTEDKDFNIELLNLKANSEYLLKIQANQSKKVKVTISSTDKLVKDEERPQGNEQNAANDKKKPEKYKVQSK